MTPMSTRHASLRLAPESGESQQAGVVVFDDIPVGCIVHARVNRPVALVEAGGAAVAPYAIERAPLPAAYTAGGVSHRKLGPVLVVSGNGVMTKVGREPTWVSLATGSLVQKGKKIHALTMPGQTGATPDLAEAERNLLRVRWTGTAVAGATALGGMVAATSASDTDLNGHSKLVPGSITFTAPSGATLKDDGHGNLHGTGGYGRIDYVTGAWSIEFTAAETGDLLATYEHACAYFPIDITLTFDPLLNE
jgi:hypothetical protein